MTSSFPKRQDLYITDSPEDCGKYYYLPVIGNFYRRRIKMVCSMLGTGDNVLDAGYGSGILFYELVGRYKNLYGIDLTSNSIEVMMRLARDNINTTLTNCDIAKMPYVDDCFGTVVSMSVLEHIANLKEPLKEIRRVLKPNGQFICAFPVSNILMHSFFKLVGFDDTRDHPSSHNHICRMLSEYFIIEETITLPRFLPMKWCLYVVCRCRKD